MALSVLAVLIIGIVIILLIGIGIFYFIRNLFTPIPRPPLPTCGGGAACPEGSVCSNSGFCIPIGTCLLEGDCADDQTCIHSVCQLKKCTSNLNCGENGYCDIPRGSEVGSCKALCTNDQDCRGSQACNKGFCEGKICLVKSDCSFDETCSNGAVRTYGNINNPKLVTVEGGVGVCIPVLDPCDVDADCATGRCDRGRRLCIQCSSKDDCGTANSVCLNGVCLRPDEQGCPDGQILINACSPNKKCLDYPVCCAPGGKCGQTCAKSSECSGNCPHCVGGICSCQKAPELPSADTCTSNNDCLSNNCRDGICVRARNCANDFFCYSSSTTPNKNFENYPKGYCPPAIPNVLNFPHCNSSTNCCQASKENAPCGNSQFCASDGLVCVNGFCRKTQFAGRYGDRCTADRDCLSDYSCVNISGVSTCRPRTAKFSP